MMGMVSGDKRFFIAAEPGKRLEKSMEKARQLFPCFFESAEIEQLGLYAFGSRGFHYQHRMSRFVDYG